MITQIIILYDSLDLNSGPCLICDLPAPPGSLLCPACANAAEAGPTCAECGGPLGEADAMAGETVCLECGE